MKTQRIISSTILMILLLWILFKFTDVNELSKAYKQLSAITIAATFTLYTIMLALRSQRFKTFFKTITHKKLFEITGIHNALSNTLPLRIGEYSFLHFLRKTGIQRTESTAVLFLIRIFDLITVGILAITSYTFTKARDLNKLLLAITIFIIIMAVFFYLLRTKWFEKIMNKIEGSKHRIISKTLHNILSHTKKHSEISTLSKLFTSSIILWSVHATIGYTIAKQLLIDVTFIEMIFVASIAAFLNGLPIQGLAGFGTVEASWTLPLVIGLGVDAKQAVTFSFIIHTLFLTYGITIGIASYWGWIVEREKTS